MKKICLSAMFGLAASLIEMNAEATKYGLEIGEYDNKLQTRPIKITIDGLEYRTDVKALDDKYRNSEKDAELVGLPGFRLDRPDKRFEGTHLSFCGDYIFVRSDKFSVGFGYYNLEGKMTDFGQTQVILNTNEGDEIDISGNGIVDVSGISSYQGGVVPGETTKLRKIKIETDKFATIGGKLDCDSIEARANDISFGFSSRSRIGELDFKGNQVRMTGLDLEFGIIRGESLEGQRRTYGFDMLNMRENAENAPTYCSIGNQLTTISMELKNFGLVQLGGYRYPWQPVNIIVGDLLDIDADRVEIEDGVTLNLASDNENNRISTAQNGNLVREGAIAGPGAARILRNVNN